MKTKNNDSKSMKIQNQKLKDLNYPPSEDIYTNFIELEDVDPENILKKKPIIKKRQDKWNEKNFHEDVSGSDLDIPGAELDDAMEEIGSEDEENNGFSIGGDDHNDLDEDNG